jgi:hypothetical protein
MELVFLAGCLATLGILLSLDFLTETRQPADSGRGLTDAFLEAKQGKTPPEIPLVQDSAWALLAEAFPADPASLDLSMVSALRLLLHHSDPSIAGEAFRLLARVPGEIPSLMDFLDRQEREILAAYAASHGDQDDQARDPGSTDQRPISSTNRSGGEEAIDQDFFALQALNMHPETIGDGENLKFLLRNVAEQDPLRREQAVLALGKSGLLVAREGIITCLQDPDQGVRSCAISALIEGFGVGALAVLEEQMPRFATPAEGMAVLQALLPLASPKIDAWLESQEHRFPEAFRPQIRAFRQARRWLEK